MISFALTAQLPSGKNQVGISTRGGRIRRFPNTRFTDWRRQAAKEMLTQVKATEKPLTGPLMMVVHYYPSDARVRDVPGMSDALLHLFEYSGLIKNDGQIQSLCWYTHPQQKVPHAWITLGNH